MGLYFLNNKKEIIVSGSKKNCLNLNYKDSLLLSPEKFRKLDFVIDIKNQKKWNKIVIKNEINFAKEGHYKNKGSVDVTLNLNLNSKLQCYLFAKIRPHGDFGNHHKDQNGTSYEIPSINVDLKDGHIFGITKFILFRPETRISNNEVLVTSIYKEVGLLAPRTANVTLTYKNEKINLIFQERINKEFLEHNRLIEGPIFKGDERFSFKYWFLKNELSRHKLSNGKWAILNNSNFNVSSNSLKIMNFINHFYESDIQSKNVVDYFGATRKTIYSDYFNDLAPFDALTYGLSAAHNLSRDDRRFYFDSVKKTFQPIYYDGGASIINNDNDIVESYKNISNNWNLSIFGEKLRPEDLAYSDKITKSAKIGSVHALKLISNIDVSILQEKLNKRGLNISNKTLSEILILLKNNLVLIKNQANENLFKAKLNFKRELKDNNAFEHVNAQYIFENNINQNYETCNLLLENCRLIELNDNEKKLMLEQELKNSENSDLVFIGEKNNFKNFSLNFHQNDYKDIEFNEKINIITYGNASININYKEKIIEINKHDLSGKVLISNGFLEDWLIKFNDHTIIKSVNLNLFRDKNGLTGCLNLYDVVLNNVNIEINGSSCEDALNVVRSNGHIKNLLIQNTSSDGADFDFSEIKINNVNIQNSKGDCLDLSYGKYKIDNSLLFKCGDKGVSIGENSTFFVKKININTAEYGVASKDFSRTNVNEGIIKNSKICVAAYSKKQEFSGSSLTINNLICDLSKSNSQESYVDKNSQLNIN